jgi:hypothetical protein
MKWVLFLLPCLLASCGSVCKIEVTTFHKLPPQGAGEVFDVRVKEDLGSLENQTYLAQIIAGFEKHGWKYQPKAKDPDLVVYLGWGITAPSVSRSQRPVFGQTGGGTTYHSGTLNSYGSSGTFSGTSYSPPTYGVVGSVPVTTVIYGRYFFVSARQRPGIDVLESKTKSYGPSGQLNVVLPLLIDAYFEDFPGPSGKTRSYTKPVPR